MKSFLICVVFLIFYGVCDGAIPGAGASAKSFPRTWEPSDGGLAEEALKRLAQKLGSELFRITKDASGHAQVEQGFRSGGVKVEKQDVAASLAEIGTNLRAMMSRKVEAVKLLVEQAEQFTKAEVWNPNPNTTYYNAKDLASTANSTSGEASNFQPMEFTEDLRFAEPVNFTSSTVHVPTNIYNKSPAVLNGVRWSKRLDDTFRDNLRRDPTLKFQYFGSAEGFQRIYPGIKWVAEPEKPDMYDCRLTNWYIRAASSPKDMIILVDISGSMTGIREEIARTTVKEIMNTLHEDDFFNIIKVEAEKKMASELCRPCSQLMSLEKFNVEATWVEPCLEDTLVQASELTKARFAEQLGNLETENIANYTDALEKAFRTLNNASYVTSGNDEAIQTRSAMCNKAIMIISDGAPENFEEIFQQFNSERRVRIFTYVIGREVTVYYDLMAIACNNRGYVTHVSTMADVRDSVEGYYQVLGRPMVLSRNHTNIWTNAYWNQKACTSVFSRPVGMNILDPTVPENFTITWTSRHSRRLVEHSGEEATSGMVMSVAQPVFNRSAVAFQKGLLIGVMAIDVPIADVRAIMKPFRWGAGSYILGTNHNGHVMFHPYWRAATKSSLMRHSYSEVDISEVEFPLQEHVKEKTGEHHERSFFLPLRVDMIEQKTGQWTMLGMRQLDDRKRIYIREYTYYYTGILDTPLSIAIAVPTRMGRPKSDMTRVTARLPYSGFQGLGIKLEGSQWRIHPDWAYCNTTLQDLAHLLKILKNNNVPSVEGDEETRTTPITCDAELVESLLFDMRATEDAAAHWTESASPAGPWAGSSRIAHHPSSHAQHSSRAKPVLDLPTGPSSMEIETVFVATRAGLTRYKNFDAIAPQSSDLGPVEYARLKREEEGKTEVDEGGGNSTDLGRKHFFEEHSKAVEESFYERTVSSANEMTFTVPLFTGARPRLERGQVDETSVMASVPVFVGQDSVAVAPVAITGVLIKTRAVKQLLLHLAKETCGIGGGECLSCHSPSVVCYLVDESGYVVTSSLPWPADDRGRFFGTLHGEVLAQMLHHNITKRHKVFDYQGTCLKTAVKPTSSSKSAGNVLRLWSGFVFDSGRFLIGQIMALMMSLIKGVLGEVEQEVWFRYENGDSEPDKDMPDVMEGSGVNETSTEGPAEADTSPPIMLKKATPGETYSCDMEYYLYHSEWTQLKASFQVACNANCTKNVGVFKVSTTNMLLVAMDKATSCPCNDKELSTAPSKMAYEEPVRSDEDEENVEAELVVPIKLSESRLCRKYNQRAYRRRPHDCFPFHQNEDSSDCGAVDLRFSSLPLMVFTFSLVIGYYFAE